MSQTLIIERPTTLALGALAWLSALPMQAREGDDLSYRLLEGVTATATATVTKTARDPFEVAESVSVVDAALIEQTQAVDLSELLADLPNVDSAGGSRSMGQQVVIRGLSNDRILFVVEKKPL